MKKILIFSDVHGRTDLVRRLYALHGDADMAIFLGDGLEDVRSVVPPMPLWCVRGNCDTNPAFHTDAPLEQIVFVDGQKIYLCHGHTRDVKSTKMRLSLAAREGECSIALFGHTHFPEEVYLGEETPRYLFNPGSLGAEPHSYGLLQLGQGGPLFSHGKLV